MSRLQTRAQVKQKTGIITCTEPPRSYRHRILLGTPTLGLVRIEWHDAMMGMVMPCNFGMARCAPLGFHVDDAQNLITKTALDTGCEWVWLVEDDTIPPPQTALEFQKVIKAGKWPIVSALYRLKGGSGEPLTYRGVATGAWTDWKLGQTIWCDGVPTGCLLIHSSILRVLWAESPEYEIQANGAKVKLRRVFENPRNFEYDPVSGGYQKNIGTSDLAFCHRVIKDGILKKAGWPVVAKKKYPFPVLTNVACGHIERDSGVIW